MISNATKRSILRWEPLSVAAKRIGNPARAPFAIHGGHMAPTPTGFAEIVSDDFR